MQNEWCFVTCFITFQCHFFENIFYGSNRTLQTVPHSGAFILFLFFLLLFWYIIYIKSDKTRLFYFLFTSYVHRQKRCALLQKAFNTENVIGYTIWCGCVSYSPNLPVLCSVTFIMCNDNNVSKRWNSVIVTGRRNEKFCINITSIRHFTTVSSIQHHCIVQNLLKISQKRLQILIHRTKLLERMQLTYASNLKV